MSENCGNCKYWRLTHDDNGFRHCNKIKMRDEVLDWNDYCSGEERTEEHKDDLAMTVDGSSYYSALMTLPEFFCAHHEKLNETNNES